MLSARTIDDGILQFPWLDGDWWWRWLRLLIVSLEEWFNLVLDVHLLKRRFGRNRSNVIYHPPTRSAPSVALLKGSAPGKNGADTLRLANRKNGRCRVR